MMSNSTRLMLRPVLALLLLASISLPVPARADADADEDKVREAFVAFQKALKDRDGDKLWPLLDGATQKAVEGAAKAVQAAYEKAGADDKAKLEKAMGLSAAELTKMTPQLYLKSNRFSGKWHEVPGGKIDKITVDGAKATVHFTEEDGDKEKMALTKQDGKWRLSVAVK